MTQVDKKKDSVSSHFYHDDKSIDIESKYTSFDSNLPTSHVPIKRTNIHSLKNDPSKISHSQIASPNQNLSHIPNNFSMLQLFSYHFYSNYLYNVLNLHAFPSYHGIIQQLNTIYLPLFNSSISKSFHYENWFWMFLDGIGLFIILFATILDARETFIELLLPEATWNNFFPITSFILGKFFQCLGLTWLIGNFFLLIISYPSSLFIHISNFFFFFFSICCTFSTKFFN